MLSLFHFYTLRISFQKVVLKLSKYTHIWHFQECSEGAKQGFLASYLSCFLAE
jgi:hypothetical protein